MKKSITLANYNSPNAPAALPPKYRPSKATFKAKLTKSAKPYKNLAKAYKTPAPAHEAPAKPPAYKEPAQSAYKKPAPAKPAYEAPAIAPAYKAPASTARPAYKVPSLASYNPEKAFSAFFNTQLSDSFYSGSQNSYKAVNTVATTTAATTTAAITTPRPVYKATTTKATTKPTTKATTKATTRATTRATTSIRTTTRKAPATTTSSPYTYKAVPVSSPTPRPFYGSPTPRAFYGSPTPFYGTPAPFYGSPTPKPYGYAPAKQAAFYQPAPSYQPAPAIAPKRYGYKPVAPFTSFTEVKPDKSNATPKGAVVKNAAATAAGEDDGEVFYIFYENEETGESVKGGLDLKRYIHEEVTK